MIRGFHVYSVRKFYYTESHSYGFVFKRSAAYSQSCGRNTYKHVSGGDSAAGPDAYFRSQDYRGNSSFIDFRALDAQRSGKFRYGPFYAFSPVYKGWELICPL
jgi:hypothetical protein